MDPRLVDLAYLASRPAAQWRKEGYWGQLPLWRRVRGAAAREPDRISVIDDSGRLTASELWASATKIARALKRDGVAQGDVVLVQLPNWREFAELVVGIEAAGAVLAFCPSTWGARETARALDLLRPKLWFISGSEAMDTRREWVRESVRLSSHASPRQIGVRYSDEDAFDMRQWMLQGDAEAPLPEGGSGLDPLEIAVTSGTTGAPKGVVHVHDSAIFTVQSTIERQNITSNDIVHVGIPVGHTFGYFYGVRCAFQAGATLLLQERWNAGRAADIIARHRATVSLGPAACIVDMLSLAEDERKKLETLRLFTQSGDPLPQPVAERAGVMLPFRISRALGMTEFGHAASTDHLSAPKRVLDSAGSAQPGVVIQIRDRDGNVLPAGEEGRVYVAGPCLFAGYLLEDRLDMSAIGADGFFLTGDLGWLGEDGYLHITGREKNVIRRGAVTIPVAAVEDALAAHPNVNHAVIVSLPDERLGERAVACIQPQAGSPAPALEDLHAHLAQLGMTKVFWPSDLRVLEVWPLGATGKIDRNALISHFTQEP